MQCYWLVGFQLGWHGQCGLFHTCDQQQSNRYRTVV